MQDSNGANMHVFNLRRMALAVEEEAGFLGTSLPVSRHFGFDFSTGKCGAGGGGTLMTPARQIAIIIFSGHLQLKDGVNTVDLSAGEVALIGPNTSIEWNSSEGGRWILNLFDDPEGTQGLRKVQLDLPLRRCLQFVPSKEVLLSEPPFVFREELGSACDSWWCGLWEATGYTRRPTVYRYYEMMLILKGEAILSTPDGQEWKLSKDDLFVVAPGAEVSWRSTDNVRKFWSFHLPLDNKQY